MTWNILNFKDKILIKTGGRINNSARRLTNNSITKTGKDEHWTTFYQSYAQPIQSNALQ